MAANTYVEIAPYINTIYDAALTIARDQNIMTSLIRTFNDRQGLAPRTVTEYSQATVNQIGEMDDLVSQQLVRNQIATLTPHEFGAQYFITDTRIETDPESIREDAALELGMAMATSVEKAIISNFSSLTGGTVGAAGSSLTWGNFFAALSVLRATNAPRPYAAVLHPYQWHDLAQAVTPAAVAITNSPAFQNEVMAQFYVGSAAGVDLFVTSNITPDGSDDARGAMFSRQALALDWRRAPRIEPERDASRRGWELNLSSVYAHGVWRANYGVQIVSDAATPE